MFRGRITLSKLLAANLLMALCILVCFVILSVVSDRRIHTEQRNHQQALLEHTAGKLEDETLRFFRLGTRLKADSSVGLLLNAGILKNSEFSDAVNKVMNKLDMVKSSFSCVDSIYVYVVANDKAYANNGLLISQDTTSLWFDQFLLPGEHLPDLANVQETYYIYQNFALYCVPVSNRGCIVLQINLQSFLDLGTFRLDFPGHQLIILDQKGRFFASSYPASLLAETQPMDFSSLADGDRLTLADTENKVLRLDNVGNDRFSLLLLCDENAAVYGNRLRFTLLFCLLGGLLALDGLVILINVASHRSMKKLALKYGAPDGEDNAQYIDRILENYADSSSLLSERMRQALDVQTQTLLTYLLHHAESPSAPVQDSFNRKYGRYFVLMIASETDSGEPNTPAISLAEAILGIKSIRESDNLSVFILEEDWTRGELAAELKNRLSREAFGVPVWGSMSEWFSGAAQVHDAFEQAMARLMALPACPAEPVCLVWEETAPCSRESGISLKQQNDLTNHTLGGITDVRVLESLLLDSGHASLAAMKRNRDSLTNLCRTICASASLPIPSALSRAAESAHLNCAYSLNWLCESYRAISANYSPEKNDMSERVMEYLNSHYQENLTLESIADAMYLSPQYLSKLFKKVCGINLFTYLSELRVKKAAALLTDKGDIRIADVAMQVGFNNTTTFTRQFKAHFGMTPEQYRRSV